MIYVLDANALIAYLRDEPGAESVALALSDTGNQCYAHALNLCEVFYDAHRISGYPGAVRGVPILIGIQALRDLQKVGVITSEDLSAAIWQTAGTLKVVHRRISLADCFGIALAEHLGATFLTADHHELDRLVDRFVCPVQFIR